MTPPRELTVLCACLIAAVVAMLGMFASEAHTADAAQQRFVDERAVVVRVQTMCRSDAQGGAVCPAGTFQASSK